MIRLRNLLVPLILLMIACSGDNDQVLSDENSILSFKLILNGEIRNGVIDQANGQIRFNSVGANLNSLVPIVEISPDATISPSSQAAQNFQSPVNYTVAAQNGETNQYVVMVENRPLGNESFITNFSFDVDNVTYVADIDQNTKEITLDLVGVDISSITPDITVSDYASISPAPNTPQDFNNEVIYTVTAEDGSTTSYSVNLSTRAVSSENSIISFSLDLDGVQYDATIDTETNEILLNLGNEDPGTFTPEIEISEYASISPETDISQDFSQPVNYTVTAEDGTEAFYTVFTNRPRLYDLRPIVGGSRKFYSGAELTLFGTYTNPDAMDSEFFLSDGQNEFPLQVISHLSYTNDFSQAVEYVVEVKIPESTPTNTEYNLIYREGNYESFYQNLLDVKLGGPSNMSLNQTEYNYNDIMIINGADLLSGLLVPSNGNLYLVFNSNNYDITVNDANTELTWTLNYHQHFPSYYLQAPELKRIMTIDNDYRIGAPVFATFN